MIDAGSVVSGETPHGTAIRDSSVAIAASAVLCAALAAAVGLGPVTLTGAVAGIAVVAGAGAGVTSRVARWSGPADRVTLTRTVLIGGCAALGVPILTGVLPARGWWLLVLLVPALALDAVDGRVARRTGTSCPAGARFDMEMDAALLMVLSLIAVRSLGWWVLAIGGMRYAYVAAMPVWPWLRSKVRFSQFRRAVAAIQGISLAAALSPLLPLTPARALVAFALFLLCLSFGRDIVHQHRTRPRQLRQLRQP